jgi:hypothetical protein
MAKTLQRPLWIGGLLALLLHGPIAPALLGARSEASTAIEVPSQPGRINQGTPGPQTLKVSFAPSLVARGIGWPD